MRQQVMFPINDDQSGNNLVYLEKPRLEMAVRTSVRGRDRFWVVLKNCRTRETSREAFVCPLVRGRVIRSLSGGTRK